MDALWTPMKLLKKFLLVSVAALSLTVGLRLKQHYTPRPLLPITIQRLASHELTFISGDGRPHGMCTGTAIAPHAILTATHCDEDRDDATIAIDNARRHYTIQKFLSDDRDHDIYLVDGPAFENIVPYVTRVPQLGEPVYFWGFGGWDYPAHLVRGKVIPFNDFSDVDAKDGEVAVSAKPIPGDSGSAIYGADGAILAVTTYEWNENGDWFDNLMGWSKHFGVSFNPNFSPAQIDEAQKFVPKPKEEKVQKLTIRTSNPFDPFGLFR